MNRAQPGAPRATDAMIREASTYRLIGLLLERPRDAWRTEVASLARESGDPDLRHAAAAAESATEGDYLAVFGPGGAVSPRETGHRRDDPGALLAGLAYLYDSFGYRPVREDPLDHVAVETGFAGFLHLKLAYATATGEGEKARMARAACDAFLGERLAAFAQHLATRLCEVGAPPYLRAAAEGLAVRVAPYVRNPVRRVPVTADDGDDGCDDCEACGPLGDSVSSV